MQNYNGKNNRKKGVLYRWLGTPNPAKSSGIAFTLACFLPTVLIFVALLFCGVFGLIVDGYETQDWFLYLSFILPQLATLIIAFLYFSYTQTDVKVELKAQKCHWKYFLIAFLLQFGLISLSELNNWFLQFLGRFGYESDEILLPSTQGFGFVGVFFVLAIFAPVMEELLFRKMILNGVSSVVGTVGTVLVCGALFSLYHQNPAQTAYQFCCGAVYTLLAIRSKSVLPTIVAHFLNNALVLILYVFGISAFPQSIFIPLMIVSGMCLIGTVAYLIFAEKTEKKQSQKTGQKQFLLYAGAGILVCVITWISVLLGI